MSGKAVVFQKTTQVRNTCNYRNDGERGDMPGKEELPILRLDAPVYCPVLCSHFLVFSGLLTSSLFYIHSLLFVASLLQFYPFLLSMSQLPAELCQHERVKTGNVLLVLECRCAPNHVLAWTLNKLMFYGCTALPTLSLLKGLHAARDAFDLNAVLIYIGFYSSAHIMSEGENCSVYQ